jgi:hypothetical protein
MYRSILAWITETWDSYFAEISMHVEELVASLENHPSDFTVRVRKYKGGKAPELLLKLDLTEEHTFVPLFDSTLVCPEGAMFLETVNGERYDFNPRELRLVSNAVEKWSRA